jgi:hypothetical protein
MSTISVSSDPKLHSNGFATRTCAPLFGYEANGASKPIG